MKQKKKQQIKRKKTKQRPDSHVLFRMDLANCQKPLQRLGRKETQIPKFDNRSRPRRLRAYLR